jgi:4-hydroxy-2-oxoheptanedioate aldolase
MYMDAGAQGVLAPYCETVEEVKEVVGAAKWRPLKGALLREVMDSGNFPSDATKKYLSDKGKNSVCIIGIESVPAVENLENILKVDGIDGVFVGPNDLSITIGVPDQYDHPEYESALRRIISTCKSANTPVMIHHQSVELTQKWLEEGARFVLYSSDARTMHNGFVDEFGAIKATGSKLGDDSGGGSKEFGEVL